MVPVVLILALSQELRWDKKVMDTIWYRNPLKSEVIGPCGGDEKTECPRRTDKSRTLKKTLKITIPQMDILMVVMSIRIHTYPIIQFKQVSVHLKHR